MCALVDPRALRLALGRILALTLNPLTGSEWLTMVRVDAGRLGGGMSGGELIDWVRVTTTRDLACGPSPSVFARSAWAAWRWDEGLVGLTYWGAPDVTDVGLQTSMLGEIIAATPAVHMILDLSRMTSMDFSPSFVSSVHDRSRDIAPDIHSGLRRAAFVPPSGWMAAFLTGLPPSIGTDAIPTRLFLEPHQALEWLEAKAGVPAIIDSLVATLQAEASTLNDIMRVLRAEPRLDLAGLATRIGRSARALQRELARQGVGFGELRRRIRIENALRLLDETDDKVEAVGLQAGWRTTRQFLACFREVVGTTPTLYRRRTRQGPAAN